MRLWDYLDVDLLDYHVHQGYVRVQQYPGQSLWIANYTNKAQFEQKWDSVTKRCRGLIYRGDLGEEQVVARPFEKFFNYGQLDRDTIPSGPIRVQDKLDGSLGILYRAPVGHGRLHIATRGSFTSDQAIHATMVLNTRYPDFKPLDGFTYLFEIIYPENRIVCDYGDTDDLFLLDVINNETGFSHLEFGPVRATWPGPVVDQFEFDSLVDVLNTEPRDGAEGMVVYFHNDGSRLKVKQDEYVRLHRLLTGVSNKTIWEILANGGDLAEILDRVPDEYYRWVKSTADGLIAQHTQMTLDAMRTYSFLRGQVSGGLDGRDHRKDFASLAKDVDNPGLQFALYDGKDISDTVWKLIKPKYQKPFWAGQGEDVA